MIKNEKNKSNSKSSYSWWKWYLKGALVWIGVILLFTYLIYFHTVIYISLPPKELFWNIIFKNAIIIIVLGLFLYFFILQNYHYTMEHIIELFTEESPTNSTPTAPDAYSKSNDLSLLIHSVDTMFKENLTYKSILEKQENILFENFLARLMKGQVHSQLIIQQTCDEYGLDIDSREFVIILFSLKFYETDVPDDKILYAYSYLKEIVNQFFTEEYKRYVYEVDGMVSCLLFSETDESLEDANSTIELARILKLTSQIMDMKFDCSLQTCVSNTNKGILGCENAFSEVLELLQYSNIVNAKESPMFYSDMKQAKFYGDNDYLWFKDERKFINCINAEDYKGASEAFDSLMNNDYIANAASIKLVRCRLFGLLNAMINALGEVRLSMDVDFFEGLDPQEALLNCQSFPELRQCAKDIFQKIDTYSQTQNKSASYNKIMNVVDYLKDNYSNPDLSIVSVADYIGINPSYLSRSFKKAIGIGLADYLHKLRIKKATQLLQDNNLSISEIAIKVGYNNTLTMNRAFKKFEGVSPSQRRQNERNPIYDETNR